MANYTQTQLIKRVLVELGIQDPEESIPAERLSYAQDVLTPFLEALRVDKVADWDIASTVPGDRYTAVVQAFMGHLGPSYGVAMPLDSRSGRTLEEERGRQQLRDLIQGQYVAPEWDRFRDY